MGTLLYRVIEEQITLINHELITKGALTFFYGVLHLAWSVKQNKHDRVWDHLDRLPRPVTIEAARQRGYALGLKVASDLLVEVVDALEYKKSYLVETALAELKGRRVAIESIVPLMTGVKQEALLAQLAAYRKAQAAMLLARYVTESYSTHARG
jgi:hypothetical protein